MSVMSIEKATLLIEFMEKYNKHFSEVATFLLLKQQKILSDNIVWLHDSLQTEQKFSMAGAALENSRMTMLADMGYADFTSSQLLELLPEECKGRFRAECIKLEAAVDKIKETNADIMELLEKKLEVAEAVMREQGGAAAAGVAGLPKAQKASGPGFYGISESGTVSKLRLSPESEIIGNM